MFNFESTTVEEFYIVAPEIVTRQRTFIDCQQIAI